MFVNVKIVLEGEKVELWFIWKEKNWFKGFLEFLEEVNIDVMMFLEQRDCYCRL